MAAEPESFRKTVKKQDKRADTSLRGNALRRALQSQPPTTLTPYEWEQWYAEHGVPDSHKKRTVKARKRWWRFWRD